IYRNILSPAFVCDHTLKFHARLNYPLIPEYSCKRIVMQEVGSLNISKDCLSLLSSCRSKLINKIGIRILESMPIKDENLLFSPDELGQIAEGLDREVKTVQNMISSCVRIFRSIAFHQPKEEEMRKELEKLGLSSECTDNLIALWESELGQATISRLSEITHTGLPRLQNVQWEIVKTTDGSVSSKSPAGSHSIVLNISTSKGDRKVKMSREEAVNLYSTLDEMQNRIDTMLE
ncbi:hypothetical protein PFISCL1PPCAC_8725, partial [Pristionchus fissidentatus]